MPTIANLSRRLIGSAIFTGLLMGGVATAAFGQATPEAIGKATGMKIEIVLEGAALFAALEDNAAARDLLALLPLAMTLEDYAATEKIAYLPRKLTTQGSPDGYHPRAGDVAYYAPWGNIAVFYKDGRYSPGLVKLGTISGGQDILAKVTSVKATIATAR